MEECILLKAAPLMFFYEKLDPFNLKDCDMKISDTDLRYLLDLTFQPSVASDSPIKYQQIPPSKIEERK